MIYIIIAIAIVKIIDLCYLFQVKEYRFDRLRSTIFEDGLISTLYLRRPRFPAKSVRNVLILGLSTALLVCSLWIYLQFWTNLWIIALVILLSPFASFLFVSVAVLLTRPFAYALRSQMVRQATALIKRRPDIVSIGISGSYGKTSTKEFLHQMLSTKFVVAKTDDNKNTDVGVAQSILKNVKTNTKYFIAEVGAYRQGEVAKATRVFMPQNAIITAFGNQHLDLYGSRENLIKAEGEILEYLPSSGTAYINADIYSFAHTAKRTKARIVSYSVTSDQADISATNIRLNPQKNLAANISYLKKDLEIETELIGSHNIANILPCIAFCMDQGMTKAEIISAVKQLKQISNKLSVHKGVKGSRILNDSGNSSVDGFIAAVNTVIDQNYRKNIILSKGIIELGKEKESSYKKVLNSIANRPIELYTTDKLFKKYDSTNQVKFLSSERALLDLALQNLDASTLLLIEGKFTPSVLKELILL